MRFLCHRRFPGSPVQAQANGETGHGCEIFFYLP
jgi:hypothetical protein